MGDLGSIPGGGHGKLLQYSCLENPHGQRQKSQAGYSPWGLKESNMTEQLSCIYISTYWVSLMAQEVKKLPAIQETQMMWV